MIYLNHSATSWPKPAAVTDAVTRCLEGLPSGQFRSTRFSEQGDPMDACRRGIAPLLGVDDWRRIFFTSGATEAANDVIRGLPLRGGRVLVTQTEHNSVLRPLYNLPDGPEITVVPCGPDGTVAPADVAAAIGPDVRAVFVNHCSNVTGAVQDLCAMREAAGRGALLVADVSQSAGCMPVPGDASEADVLIFTGHKAMLGPAGTGGFFLREGTALRPGKYGGTGTDSRTLVYRDGDWNYEPGTQNLPALAGLAAGAALVMREGVERIALRERALIRRLREGLSALPGVRVWSGDGPALSFTLDRLSPADLGFLLQESCGIIVRAGLHCAPLIHEAMGTAERGTVRASVGSSTTEDEIDALLDAVREIGSEGRTW